MLKTLSMFFALGLLSPLAYAAQMSQEDSRVLENILKASSGEKAASFSRVSCRWKFMTPTICVYHHVSGNRDSFAWLNAARAADIILHYKKDILLPTGLSEVSITNLVCEGDVCSFE